MKFDIKNKKSSTPLEDFVSEENFKHLIDTTTGVATLNSIAFSDELDKLKTDYHPLSTIYFLRDNGVKSGIIKSVDTSFIFDSKEIKVETSLVIATEDGEILRFPGDIPEFEYRKEDILNKL